MNDVFEEENDSIEKIIQNHSRTCGKNDNVEDSKIEVYSINEEIINDAF